MPINYKIERKNFELIGDQIGAIIAYEFVNQVYEFENLDCLGVNVYRERNTPIDNTELAVVNISYGATEYDNKHQGCKTGMNTYFIDIFCQSKSTEDEDGDKLSNLKLQRLIGIVDDILENPIYKFLEFSPLRVSHTIVENIEVISVKKEEGDALASTFGRLTFKVKANESTGLLDGVVMTEAFTKVKLGLTEKGYRYEQ